jgi:hypothetical protein
MFQPSIQNFFHAVQLGTPHVPHVIESAVDSIEATVDFVEPLVYASETRIHVGSQVTQAGIVDENPISTASKFGTARAIARIWF